jgi:hypothetical protein
VLAAWRHISAVVQLLARRVRHRLDAAEEAFLSFLELKVLHKKKIEKKPKKASNSKSLPLL